MAPANEKLYPIADWHLVKPSSVNVRAVRISGTPRKPCKGEWYLSGAIPEAYKALEDVPWEYYIAKLVTIRRTETIEVTGDYREASE